MNLKHKTMKRLIFILAFFALISCEKGSTLNPTGIGNVCAECTEQTSGFVAPEYCGTPQEVDFYIKELKRSGSSAGLVWSCKITGK